MKTNPFDSYPRQSASGKCLWCGTAIGRLMTENGYPARSTSIAIMDKHGLFCRLRCAAEYGVANAKALRGLK